MRKCRCTLLHQQCLLKVLVSSISSIILGASIIIKPLFLGIVIIGAITPPSVAVLSAEEIAKLTKEITVLIKTPGSSGSGIIIAKNKNTYTVLTAKHVLNNIHSGEEIDIFTFDRQRYRLNIQNIREIPNVDLAVVEFISERIYPVARLGSQKNISLGSNVYVAGYPLPTEAIPQSVFNFTIGQITSNESSSFGKEGYTIIYSNNTLPGMSGGPVVNTQGEVIGIHGRADTVSTQDTPYDDIKIKTGFNLGIPIDVYLNYSKVSSRNDTETISLYPENKTLNMEKLPQDEPGLELLTNLENYLSKGDLWSADIETKSLILNYDRSRHRKYLSKSDIYSLPCSLLIRIDRLWTRESRSQFGFSVQKKLWSGSYDEFARSTGWLYRGLWMKPQPKNYSQQLPLGHLPRQFLDGPIWIDFIDKINSCGI